MKAKYRPFKNSDEFIKQTGLDYGDEIEIKNKSEHYVLTIHGIFRVSLLLANQFVKDLLNFKELFKYYEIKINGEWQPFGVLDES